MKTTAKIFSVLLIAASGCMVFSSYRDANRGSVSFPYKKAGLTDQQAAAHLLGRFSYGPTPGQVEAVAKMGPEKWFMQQLEGNLPDEALTQRLLPYDAINLSNQEVANTFPKAGQLLRMGIKDGVIDKDAVNKTDMAKYRAELQAYMQKQGFRPQQELYRQFINQKILRAAYTNNQLQEILTDFWFNHFNVSITKNDCAAFIPAYERDVIRPNVFGKFSNILLATAKSPAMLYYLDNFSSAASNAGQQPLNAQLRKRLLMQAPQGMVADSANSPLVKRLQQAKKNQGLNENYAREVMELHTLGVDGGYSQQDVTQAARILTGWTVYPLGNRDAPNAVQKMLAAGGDRLQKQGFVHEGDFLFAANRHDNGEKTVLGKKFANGGYQEGVELLQMLAHHPSAAQFISRKLAIRFVSDEPPKALVDRMAKAFTDHDGDIREVLLTMVSSPEFWSPAALREKTKSPFELAISAVRSLNADIKQPYQLYTWVTRMGQKMYYYQAPTGFPDKGQYWINTGSLLNRMNFGLALASQRIPGISIDLAALNNHHEPESAEAALVTYGKFLLPERNLGETIKRLTPMLNDPSLEKKIDEAAGKTAPAIQPGMNMVNEDAILDEPMKQQKPGKGPGKKNLSAQVAYAKGANSMLSQVVGIIIGSPEFQRK